MLDFSRKCDILQLILSPTHTCVLSLLFVSYLIITLFFLEALS